MPVWWDGYMAPELRDAGSGSIDLRAPIGVDPATLEPAVPLEDIAALHKSIRAAILEGFHKQMGHRGTPAEIQASQGVAFRESTYGRGWHGEGSGSHNQGAVQSGRAPCDPATEFLYTDSHPDGTRYQVCFRRYASDVDGVADMVRHLFQGKLGDAVRRAVARGDAKAFSAAMYDKGYYEGSGATREARIQWHASGWPRILPAIAAANAEPVYLNGPGGGGKGSGLGWLLLAGLGGAMLLGRRRRG